MSKETMLTTIDNPFDYFTQFDQWLLFDKENGYNSCEHLARIAQISDDMSQKEVDEEIERAVDSIIEDDFLGIYKKITRETAEDQ